MYIIHISIFYLLDYLHLYYETFVVDPAAHTLCRDCLSLFVFSFLPQMVEADDTPLESGSAPGFFSRGSFSWPLSHLVYSEGPSCFSSDDTKLEHYTNKS